MWITGKGIFPKKAFLHSQTVAVESLPVLHKTAGFLNWALTSRIIAMLLFSSSWRYVFMNFASLFVVLRYFYF